MGWNQQAGGLSHATFRAIADHRPADLFCGCKPNPDAGCFIHAMPGLEHDGTTRTGRGFGGQKEVWPNLKVLNLKFGLRHSDAPPLPDLGGQALAALGPTTGNDLLTILGGHTRAPSVTARTHETGRLKSALHGTSSGTKSRRGE